MTQVGEVIFSHRRKKTRWLEWALKVWSMIKNLINESGEIHSMRERNEGCGKSWRANKHKKEGWRIWLEVHTFQLELKF